MTFLLLPHLQHLPLVLNPTFYLRVSLQAQNWLNLNLASEVRTVDVVLKTVSLIKRNSILHISFTPPSNIHATGPERSESWAVVTGLAIIRPHRSSQAKVH